MESKEIDNLIQKYFDGESTLKDEIMIRRYLLENDSIPEKHERVKAIFLFFDSERHKKSSLQFEKLVPKLKKKRTINRMFYYAAAASIALLFGVWLLKTGSKEKNVYAYINGKPVENKEMAYKEAQKALLMMSKNLNKGTENINQLCEFDKAISIVNKE